MGRKIFMCFEYISIPDLLAKSNNNHMLWRGGGESEEGSLCLLVGAANKESLCIKYVEVWHGKVGRWLLGALLALRVGRAIVLQGSGLPSKDDCQEPRVDPGSGNCGAYLWGWSNCSGYGDRPVLWW